MSASDRGDNGGWPKVERRTGDRRSGRDQRVHPVSPPASGERRQHERRSGSDRRDESAWSPLPIDDVGAGAAVEPVEALIAAATAARGYAQASYSGFAVGAALETAEGYTVGGCNIENATYGLTLCAERVALVKALSDGHGVFTRIAVVADTEELDAPLRALPPAALGVLRRSRRSSWPTSRGRPRDIACRHCCPCRSTAGCYRAAVKRQLSAFNSARDSFDAAVPKGDG